MPSATSTVIAARTCVRGMLYAEDDLIVEGTVDGGVQGEGSVLIASGATVRGEVRGKDVVVAGKLDHPIFASGTVRLLATAEVRGNIEAVRVAMDEGALFEGQMKMLRAGATPTPPATVSKAPPSPPAARDIPGLPEIGRSRLIRKATS